MSRTIKRNSLYFTLVLLIALGAVGILSFVKSDVNNVSAQVSQDFGAETQARPDMLSYALRLGTVTDFSIYGGNGVVNRGSSVMNGKVGDPSTIENDGAENLADLNKSFSAINQLPCKSLENTELGGETFTPGVYCLSSANLAGELKLNGNGDPNGIFLFRVNGDFNTADNSRITLLNEAFSGNVYFVSNSDVNIAPNTAIEGNIYARNNVDIKGGSTINGKVLTVDGKVSATEAQLGPGTGVLQICKAVPPGQSTGTGNLSNRIFQFQIGGPGGPIFEAPVGGCTGPITLPVGANSITELTTGRFTNQPGTFSGRFRLISVDSPTPNALGAVNLPGLTANVFIRSGDISNQTVVNFTNTFAVNAVVEICKRTTLAAPLDPDVTGFFTFFIDAIPGATFTAPVGGCTGPIQVNVPTTPGPVPAPATIRVTERGEPGFTLEAASTFPANRFVSLTLNSGISNADGTTIVPNPGGGFVTATVLEGGAASQTTVNFFNRSNPGLVKVCKIAGPGIPQGATFRFRVDGTAPSNPPPGAILPGVAVSRFVDVIAGPAAQGGFCNFVRTLDTNVDPNAPLQTFIVGTNVTVTEISSNLVIPPGVIGDIRVSRIRVNQMTTGFTSNLAARTVTFQARRETREAEFTNIFFQPSVLKICKVAGSAALLGQNFTFNVTVNNPDGLTPGQTVAPVSVVAGLASQGGNCVFVDGPNTPTATVPPIGTFRVGSVVTVTEQANAGTSVSAILSNTGTPSNVNLGTRTASLTIAAPGGFNEIQFVNITTPPPPVAPRAAVPFDFDGDSKSDVSVFRPSNGTWYINGSTAGFYGHAWGTSTDRATPADFDGDGKTDIAVFRSGTWYILGSTSGFRAVSFGQNGDIPQPGDFDGDGKADISVFRPSNGAWYRLNSSTDEFIGVAFGQNGDRAISGDYDGDGKTDIAVRRGDAWYIMGSTSGFTARQFGYASDIPVPADFDGDGKVDIAVYRAGSWYILGSRDGYYGVNFGNATDSPIPADYDGDGRADISVFRAGNWFTLRSTESSMSSVTFGVESDQPIPGSYLR